MSRTPHFLDKSLAPTWWRLRRFEAAKRRTAAAFRKDYDDAKRAGKSTDELERIMYDTRYEVGFIDEQIRALRTLHLLRKADRYGVPRPAAFDPATAHLWDKGEYSHCPALTPHAYAELRSAVRKERKERREMWLPIAALIVTVVGSAIGVVAALKKWHVI